jgi:hypothetical protein
MSAAAPFCRRSFSPQGYWAHVPDTEVQKALRQAFSAWGLPQRMRVDNGKPWGSWSDLPPQLALWLIGLGVEVIWNPPCEPQKNGVVERSQGTGKRWAEPHCCATAAALQEHFDDLDRLQREEYPHQRGRTRGEVYPELVHSGHKYSRAWERRHWDLSRVQLHLRGYAVTRRVDQTGNVSLYNRNQYVGVVHGGKTIYVMFDAESCEWLFADADGRELRRRQAAEITADRIIGLQVPGNK